MVPSAALTLLLACCPAPQDPPTRQLPPQDGGLAYVERSAGLQQPTLDSGFTEIELGDVDADGHPDVVSVGDHGSPFVNTQEHGVMVWFGDGRGGFSVFQAGNFGYGGVALGDANNDGRMDVGYGIHHDYSGVPLGDQILEVALGDGTGRAWTAWDTGLATNGETWGMSGTDFADIDNDGDLDIGANAFGCCAGVHVYRNLNNGSWQQSFGFLGSNSNQEFQFGDFDNDGHADFVALHQSGTAHRGDGRGGFVRADAGLPAFGQLKRFDLGDVDGDGKSELLRSSNGGVELWQWGGAGWSRRATQGLPASGPFQATRFTHANADGKPDIVAYGGRRGVVYLNLGGNRFKPGAELSAPRSGTAVVLRAGADLDHNGRHDVVLVQQESTGGIFGGSRNRLYCFLAATPPARPFARVVAPGPNRVLRQGSVRRAEWLAAAPAGSTVALELSTSGPNGPWTPVAAGLPDNGRAQWTVPAVPSTTCHLRLTLTAGATTLRDTGPAFEIR